MFDGVQEGHVGAQLRVGMCYEAGDGMPCDLEEACRWYRKVAEHSQVQTCVCTGRAGRCIDVC